MIINISFWAFIGTIYLVILSYQDIKNKMLVDDRHNFFMFGLTSSLYFIYKPNIYYSLTLLVLVLALRWFFNKYKVMGEADNNTIIWIFTGFGLVGPYILIDFIFFYTLGLCFYMGFRKLYKIKVATPLYPIILFIFIAINIFRGLY